MEIFKKFKSLFYQNYMVWLLTHPPYVGSPPLVHLHRENSIEGASGGQIADIGPRLLPEVENVGRLAVRVHVLDPAAGHHDALPDGGAVEGVDLIGLLHVPGHLLAVRKKW